MRWILAFCLGLAACARSEPETVLADIHLPVASMGVEDRNDDPEPRVVVSLTRNGEILVDYGTFLSDKHHALIPVTLTALSTFLDIAKRSRDPETLREGVQVSRLFVLLRVDRDAPWQHVQSLLSTLAEHKYYKVQFGVQRADAPAPTPPRFEAKLKAWLPTAEDEMLDEAVVEPEDAIVLIRVGIGTRRENRETRGGKNNELIRVPATVKYHVRGRDTKDLDELTGWIVEHIEEDAEEWKGAQMLGEIKAAPKVPFRIVVEVLNRMRAAGLERVDFPISRRNIRINALFTKPPR